MRPSARILFEVERQDRLLRITKQCYDWLRRRNTLSVSIHSLSEMLERTSKCWVSRQTQTVESVAAITWSGRLPAAYPVYTSPTGSGYNLQTTIPGDMTGTYSLRTTDMRCSSVTYPERTPGRRWRPTVLRLGTAFMLDDLQYGLIIAKILACMFRDGEKVSSLSRPELAELTNSIAKTDKIYFGSKCCQHGSNYDMGDTTMSLTIFKQSEGTIDIPTFNLRGAAPASTSKRYWGIPLWHRSVSGEDQGHLKANLGLRPHRNVLRTSGRP